MSRSLPFAKDTGRNAHSYKTASDHVAVLAALDYACEKRHDRSTTEMFAALISSYWRDLSLGERRTIAKALADRPDLPRSLINHFLADHFTVANLIIDASPLIDEPDFYRIVDSHVMPMIRVVARRTLPSDLVTKLACLRDSSTSLALALNGGIYPDPASLEPLLEVAADNRHVARALALRADLPLKAMMMLYPELGLEERRKVIDQAERASLINLANDRQRAPVRLMTEDQRLTLLDLSKRLGRREFLDRLNGNLMLDRRYLDAILENDSGEIQAIVFAGLGFSTSEATTLFIVMGGHESRSYGDIKALIDLFERVKWRISGQFISAWRKYRPVGNFERPRADSLGERADSRRAGAVQSERGRNILEHGVIKDPLPIAASDRR